MPTDLRFIKSESTTSNVSSISVTDCFSSKYDHYQVVLAVDDVDSEVAIEFRMINSLLLLIALDIKISQSNKGVLTLFFFRSK